MTIYVDTLTNYPSEAIKGQARRWGTRWAHIWTDGDIEELHVFARKLGLKREYFQNHHAREWMHHYDVAPRKRALAVRLGAIEISARDWFRRHMQLEGQR